MFSSFVANFASQCLVTYPVMHVKFLKSCFHRLTLTIFICDLCVVVEVLLIFDLRLLLHFSKTCFLTLYSK